MRRHRSRKQSVKESTKKVLARRDLRPSAKVVYVVLCDEDFLHIKDLTRCTGLGRATCYLAIRELAAHDLAWFPERGFIAALPG